MPGNKKFFMDGVPSIIDSINIMNLSGLQTKKALRILIGIKVMLLDLVSVLSAYVIVSLLYQSALNIEQLVRSLFVLLPIFLLINLNNDAYSPDVLRENAQSAWRSGSGLVLASLLMLLIFFFLKISDDFSRALIGLGGACAVVLIGFARFAAAQLAREVLGDNPYARLVLHEDEQPKTVTGDESVFLMGDLGLRPEPMDPEMLAKLGKLAIGMDAIVVHCRPENRRDWAFMLKSLDVASEILTPEIADLQPLAINTHNGKVSLVLASGQLSLHQRAIKRGFDLAVTLCAVPFLAPFMMLAAIAIKIDSRGPVLFKQERIGRGNRKFKILKFRTMYVEMQDELAKRTTRRGDARVTRVGAFLRRTSIDELPQFINVLLGDMSIVGPRPHTEQTAVGSSLLWEIDPAYWHRHVVKPGITGLAQVRGHRGSLFREEELKDRLNADLEYLSNWSLSRDIRIWIRTLAVLVHKNAF